jgi:large subunit ribosomal protein L10
MKAQEVNELRKDLWVKKIHLEVVKNTMASLAFKEIGQEGIGKLLEGPSALVSGAVDSAALAKTIVEWSKKVPSLKVKGAMVENRIISASEVEALSKLPAKPVLYTQLATLLQSPLSRLARVLNAPLQNLRGDMEALKNRKEKEATSNTGG